MTNSLIAFVSFVVFALTVLGAARLGKTYLFGLSITFILVSNITVQINVEVLPNVTISWAIIIYSLVYLITDLVIEFYGRRTAYVLAVVNLAVQLLLWAYVGLSLMVTPDSSGNSAQAYETMRVLFGTTARITIAAVVAALGPFMDVFVTSRIREFLKRRRLLGNETLNLIARAKLSTFLGEAINTVLFFSLALLGTGTDLPTLASIIVTAILVKWAISLADTPFLYMFLRFFNRPLDVSTPFHAAVGGVPEVPPREAGL